MRFSHRTDHDPTPNDFSLALTKARESGKTLIDLTESNPTRVGLPYEEARICAALSIEAPLVYDPRPFGLRSARERVALEYLTHHGVVVAPERIMLTSSTSDAYAYLFKVLCDPGDEILVPAPSYPLLAHIAALEPVELVPYPLRETADGPSRIDLRALRAAVTDATRAVIVVSPNNPTGNLLTLDEHRAIEKLGLPLIVDEVFLDYVLREGGEHVVSAVARERVLTFALSGVSKRCLLPQAKLSWIAVNGPPGDVDAALARLELVGDTFLSPGAQIQHALGGVLAATETVRVALRQRLAENGATLWQGLNRHLAQPLPAEGGWYGVVRLAPPWTDDAAVYAILAAGAVVHPGWLYDFDDDRHLVVSLIAEPDVFRAGVAAMSKALATLPRGPYR